MVSMVSIPRNNSLFSVANFECHVNVGPTIRYSEVAIHMKHNRTLYLAFNIKLLPL